MTSKVGPAFGIINPTTQPLSQAIDKWLPGGVRPVFQQVTVVSNARLLAMSAVGVAGTSGAVQVVPAPPAGFAVKPIDFRIILSDTPAKNPANTTINGVAGFSTQGLDTTAAAATGGLTALATGTTCALQYSADGAAVTANNVCSTAIAAAVMTAAPGANPIVAGGVFSNPPAISIPQATPICIANAGANYTGGANTLMTVIVNYEVISSKQ